MLLSTVGPQVANPGSVRGTPLIEQKFRNWISGQKKLGNPKEDMIDLCLNWIDENLTGEAADSLEIQAAEDAYFQAVCETILDQSAVLWDQSGGTFTVHAQKKREIAGKFITIDWQKLEANEVNPQASHSIIQNIGSWLKELKQGWEPGLKLLDLCINWVDEILNQEEYDSTELQIAEMTYFQAVYDVVWEQLVEPRYEALKELIISEEKDIIRFLSGNYWAKQASNGGRGYQPKDVYQEAYLALNRNRRNRKYIDEGTRKAYFLKICENIQKEISNKKGRIDELISEEVLEEHSMKEEDAEMKEKLAHCLAQLTPKHRELLMKTIVWGYSAKEIVEELMYKSISVVSSTKKRMIEKLQACLSSK